MYLPLERKMYFPVEREIVVCLWTDKMNVIVQEMKMCLPLVRKIY